MLVFILKIAEKLFSCVSSRECEMDCKLECWMWANCNWCNFHRYAE